MGNEVYCMTWWQTLGETRGKAPHKSTFTYEFVKGVDKVSSIFTEYCIALCVGLYRTLIISRIMSNWRFVCLRIWWAFSTDNVNTSSESFQLKVHVITWWYPHAYVRYRIRAFCVSGPSNILKLKRTTLIRVILHSWYKTALKKTRSFHWPVTLPLLRKWRPQN